MKKKVLGVIALVSLLVLPFVKVNAAEIGGIIATTASAAGSIDATNSTFSDALEQPFYNKFSLKQTDTPVTLYARVMAGQKLPKGYVINGEVDFSSSTYSIGNCKKALSSTNAKLYSVDSCEVSGTKVTFKITTLDEVVASDTKAKDAKLVTLDITGSGSSSDVCEVSLSYNGGSGETPVTPKCTTDKDGNYLDDKGNKVTKEEYEKACNSENPQTGSAVSYVIILGGIVLAGVVFTMTKKSKIYNV